jgi:hypothetical protein
LRDAETANNPLTAFAAVKKANALARDTEKYADIAAIVNTGNSTRRYDELNNTKRQISDLFARYRPQLTAKINSGSPQHERIGRKLAQILEADGFTITNGNPAFLVNLNINDTEEDGQTNIFVRSNFTITLETTRAWETLFSYSKNMPRAGHINLDGAYNRAWLNIEKDLDEHFSKELNAVF